MTSAAVGLALGVALLAAAGPARAATLTYDLAGSSELRIRSGYEPAGHTAMPFAEGSSLTLELDANGDGVEGDVTIASSHFSLLWTIPVSTIGSVSIDATGEISGGLGARAGDIVWSEPAGFALQGTVVCFGIVCELLGVLAGTAYPIELLYQLTDSAPVPAIDLGVWSVDRWSTPGSFVSSGQSVLSTNTQTGEWAMALQLSGREVPEPSSGALLFAVALALALRRIA